MSALEEYRKALAQATSESDDHVLVHLADAAIAELEADALNASNVVEKTREQLRLCNIDQFNAEAEVAVRDRMLRLAWDDYTGSAGYIFGPDAKEEHEWLADLRARAEEGRE